MIPARLLLTFFVVVTAPGTGVIYGVFAVTAGDWLLASDRAMRWLNRNLAAALRGACRPLALERA